MTHVLRLVLVCSNMEIMWVHCSSPNKMVGVANVVVDECVTRLIVVVDPVDDAIKGDHRRPSLENIGLPKIRANFIGKNIGQTQIP